MNTLQHKKILITGATGFIGIKVTERLVELGSSISLLIRNQAAINKIPFLKDKVKIYEADITNFKKVKEIVTLIKPQIVFHIAAFGVYTYTDTNDKNIKTMIDVNIEGTINLLLSLKDTPCKLFINTGSCFEYGDSKTPFSEDSKLTPSNIYGITKVTSTLMAHELAQNFNIPIVTLRPFTVYGPGEGERRFIATVIRNCLVGQDIQIPEQKIVRDFIFIEDVVRAYVMVADNDNPRNIVMNISTGVGISLEEAVNIIKALIPSKSVIQKGAFSIRPGEVLSLIGSNKRAKKYLNWQPHYSFEKGLREIIKSIKEINS